MASDGGNIGLIILNDDFHCFDLRNELEVYPTDMIHRMKEKLMEIVEEEDFKFKKIILNIVLAHEYALSKEHAKALKIFEELEGETKSLILKGCDHFLFDKTCKALFNVINTCKAYTLILQNEEDKARELLPKIVPYSELDTSNKASLFGIRSMVFMEYGLYGHKVSLENAKKANDIDPKNAYWFFLIGKCLGRIRRVEKPFDIPSSEERIALKTAIKMIEGNYLFILFTAEVFVETSTRTFRFHRRNGNLYGRIKVSVEELSQEASNLFRKSVEIQPNCSHVLFRAAKGFMNLPYPYKDINFAKELITKGLEVNPRNPFGNHLLARYYERHAYDIPTAIKHLEICSEQKVFGAEMDLLRIQHKLGHSDVLDKLKNAFEKYSETPRKLQILTQMASYHIFVAPDTLEACRLIKEGVKMNYDDNITNHRSIFLENREPFSILDVLIDEIKIDMENKCDPEKVKIYEKFIFDMNDSNVPIAEGRAKNLKKKILLEEEELKAKHLRNKTPLLRNPQKPRKPIPFSKYNNHAHKPNLRNKDTKFEHVHAVKKVNDFFDSWSDSVKNTENEEVDRQSDAGPPRNPFSTADSSPTKDSRFSTSHTVYRQGENKRYPNNDDDPEMEFDRLSISSRNSRPDNRNYSNRSRGRGSNSRSFDKPNSDKLETEFDRLYVSSQNSRPDRGFSNRSRGGRGFSHPRSFEQTDKYESTFSRDKQRPRNDSETSNNTWNWRNRDQNVPSKSRHEHDHRSGHSSKYDRDVKSESHSSKDSDERIHQRSNTYSKSSGNRERNQNDSDDDLMSYFKKK